MSVEPDNHPIRKCNPREELFCRAVANGAPASNAFRSVWSHPDWEDAPAANEAHRIMKRPQVIARIAQLRKKAERIVLLSVNQRLGVLTQIIQGKHTANGDKVRAVKAYTELAGDAQPDRLEITGADGAAIEVSETGSTLTVREKMALLKAAMAKK